MEQVTIEVRLFATLREGRFRSQRMTVASPRQVIEELEIEEKDAYIVLRNGHSIPLDTQMAEGDTLSIFPQVGGG